MLLLRATVPLTSPFVPTAKFSSFGRWEMMAGVGDWRTKREALRLTTQQWSCELAVHKGPIVFPKLRTPLITLPQLREAILCCSFACDLLSFVHSWHAPKKCKKFELIGCPFVFVLSYALHACWIQKATSSLPWLKKLKRISFLFPWLSIELRIVTNTSYAIYVSFHRMQLWVWLV